jgi:pectin-derived oligosaccharide transport system permease protein
MATAARKARGAFRLTAWHIALIVMLIVILYPVAWMIGTSFKTDREIISSISPWPQHFILANFPTGWSANPGVTFGTFFVNSLIVALGAVAGNLIACSLTAYAFARLRFRFRGLFFAIMIVTIMMPYHVLIVPQYTIFRYLHWVNTFLPLIVPKFLATDAFFIFLMVQFMRGVPPDLDDAARLDGCGPYRTYWYIMLPLVRPALITTAIFTFIWTWNDYFTQLVYLNSTSKFTVPVGLGLFIDQSGIADYGPMMAMSVLALLPVFLFFLAFQRFIVEGITTTGVTG